MSFFYFTLGLSIMTGIFSVIEYSSMLINQQMDSLIINDDYLGTTSQQIDRIFLRILNDSNSSFGGSSDVCYLLNKKFIESGQSELYKEKYLIGKNTPSNHNDLLESCVLTNGLHRLILVPSKTKQDKFVLYSCNTTKKEYCSFELE